MTYFSYPPDVLDASDPSADHHWHRPPPPHVHALPRRGTSAQGKWVFWFFSGISFLEHFMFSGSFGILAPSKYSLYIDLAFFEVGSLGGRDLKKMKMKMENHPRCQTSMPHPLFFINIFHTSSYHKHNVS